ncbi:hypothetical protein EV183_005570, partial [Coemansia sp. RSA 2336]
LNYNRLLQTHSHLAIVYPRLLSLKIEIEGADFNNYQWRTPKRMVFFPRLQRFALNHVYPFSDDTIFRGSREKSIESISITVDANSLEALGSHGMFDKAKPCANLKHLTITQEDESYLFDELELPADMLQRWLSVAPALCSFSLLIDDILLKQPLIACVQSSLPCNSSLQLLIIPHVSLNLQEIMLLLSNLPSLTDLHCTSEGLGPELASCSVLSELVPRISLLFSDIQQPFFKFWRAIVNDPDSIETSVAWPSVALALLYPGFSYTAVLPSQRAAYESCLKKIMSSEDFQPHQEKIRQPLIHVSHEWRSVAMEIACRELNLSYDPRNTGLQVHIPNWPFLVEEPKGINCRHVTKFEITTDTDYQLFDTDLKYVTARNDYYVEDPLVVSGALATAVLCRYATATRTALSVVAQLAGTPVPTSLAKRADEDSDSDDETSQINIDVSFLFDWGNAPGTGPYFTSNNIDAAQQITTAALLGSVCLLVFSLLRLRWPELYSHRLRLRHMRPSNIPRTLLGWIYPACTMSDRHVLETIGLDAVLYFRAFRMLIYMFICLSAFGMLILYPVNFYWGREEDPQDDKHTIFDSPIANVSSLSGRYSAAHAFLAYVFAIILFFYIDRFALHTISMRWHYLLLTRRSGNSRTLMITHLPRELRSEGALTRFIRGMRVGPIEAVHVTPMSQQLSQALARRTQVLQKLEHAFADVLGNPCRARTYDPELLKRVVLTDSPEARELERRLVRRWARSRGRSSKSSEDGKRRPAGRPRTTVFRGLRDPATGRWQWPLQRVDAIDHWRDALFAADRQLQQARETFDRGEGGTTAFVTMASAVDAQTISQLHVHARPDTCKIRMAPEARAIVWKSIGRPYSSKVLRYLMGVLMTIALLLLWCVPVILISTLISLRFLVTRSPGLAEAVKNSQFLRSLLSYTLPSLILTIFLTILPRLLWSFVLAGGDRAYSIADKNMQIRHLYFLVIYIVVIFGMSGPVWANVYDLFTDFGGFWSQLVNALPQMATWYCVYVMLYGAGYQVLKLLHLKSVCRYLFLQAKAHTPRDYMKAISPVFIDWGTFQPYTVLFFFIGILYAHLQPLLLPMCLLYFLVGTFVMRYMCIYSWYFRQQTAGLIWPVIFRRMVLCILAYQALTTAVFSGDDNRWFIAPMLVLMLFTWYYFWVRCPALKRLGDSLPLQLLREAERRRHVMLMNEQKSRLAAAGSPQADLPHDAVPVPAVLLTGPTTDSQSATHNPDDASLDLEEQALMPQPPRPPRTLRWLSLWLQTALVHPVRSLISSVSFALVYLRGDPAAPLWEHMDDYAFPERVEKLTPAGRTSEDPRQAKEQPGSMLDITKSIIMGIPRACMSIGQEFFMRFHIPRAYLDTSVVSYPRAENVESAFKTQHRRRFPKQKKVRQNAPQEVADRQSERSDLLSVADDDQASLTRGRDESVFQEQFCLAPPHDLPASFVPRISEHEPAAPSPVPLNAMLYQSFSNEIPFGTQMNRRFTDFSQPNMSYLPGILDSTNFLYLHPGLYGDLPSLWLPVESLKRRTQAKRSAAERFRSAMHAVESAFEENVIGEQMAEKLHHKRKQVQRRLRDNISLTPFSTRTSPRTSMDSGSAVEAQGSVKQVSLGERPKDVLGEAESIKEAVTEPQELPDPAVQQKVNDLLVRSKCSSLGIDPSIVEQWDPLQLHRCSTLLVPVDEANSVTAASGAATEALSESDSDFDDHDQDKNIV